MVKGLLLRRPRSAPLKPHSGLSCLPAGAADRLPFTPPNLIFPNFLLFQSSGSSSQSVPTT